MSNTVSEETSKNLPYTLAFRMPLAFRDYFCNCQKKLAEVCSSFEPYESAHMTLKFLGFSSDFLDDARIIEMLPLIYEITAAYFPLKIYTRGFGIFSYDEGKKTVVYLKVLQNQALTKLHNELCDRFAEFDFFPHADKQNFLPHITLSKEILENKHEKLARIACRSNKMAKRHLKLDDLVVMTPFRMFPVTPRIDRPLICPPVK